MNEYKTIKKHLSMNLQEFKSIDTVHLIPQIHNLLAKCGIEKKMKDNLRFDNPRFLARVQKINKNKNKIKNSLREYSKKTPSLNNLRSIMHKTLVLYDLTNQSLLEIINREIGSVD